MISFPCSLTSALPCPGKGLKVLDMKQHLLALVVSKLKPEEIHEGFDRDEVKPGTYELNAKCHLTGIVVVGEDGEATPVFNIPVEELIARVLTGSGLPIEKQLTVLKKAWKGLTSPNQSPEVKAMINQIVELRTATQDKLPKAERKGRVSVKSVKLTFKST